MISRSSTFQYSLAPLGSGLRIMNGIFFCLSSSKAMLYPFNISEGTFTNGCAP